MMYRTAFLISMIALLWTSPARAEEKSDGALLQGTWKVISFTENGQENYKNLGDKLVFAQDKIAMQHDQKTDGGKFTLESTATPKAIDIKLLNFKVTARDKKILGKTTNDSAATSKTIDAGITEETVRGIYELTGDRLKVCMGEAGDPRPTEFASKRDSKIVLVELEREKP